MSAIPLVALVTQKLPLLLQNALRKRRRRPGTLLGVIGWELGRSPSFPRAPLAWNLTAVDNRWIAPNGRRVAIGLTALLRVIANQNRVPDKVLPQVRGWCSGGCSLLFGTRSIMT